MRFGPLQYGDQVLLNLGTAQSRMNKAVKDLSSGLRINGAADDPSGLAIAEHLRSVSLGLQEGQQQIQNAKNALVVAEGAMQSITELLQRMRSLVVEGNSDVDSQSDKANLQAEINQLTLEINRIASNANFNGKKLLDGSLSPATPQPAQFVYVQNPNTSAGGAQSPPQGPPLTDPNWTNILPGTEQLTFQFSVDSYDASTNQLTVSYVAQSVDPSFGPKQTGSFQVTAGTNFPTVLGPPPGPGPFQLQILDQNMQQVMNYAFNNLSASDVGKTSILTSVPTQSFSPGQGLAVNLGTSEGNTVSISIGAMDAYNIGAYGITVGDTLTNQASEGRLDYAIDYVNGQRAQVGAESVALGYASDDASIQYVNQVASESSIRDANIAQEVGDFTRTQILTQVGTSVLSQMEVSTALLTNILVGALGAQTIAARL